MNIKALVDELEESDAFKAFKKDHSDAYFAAGFFILDLKEQKHNIQLDYFLPSQKKVAGFTHPFNQVKIFEDTIDNMTKLSTDPKIDLDQLETTCENAMKEAKINLIPTKIIAVLRDGIWNATCMNDALGIIRMHIDAQTGDIKDINKGSLMDFMGFKKA